MRHIDVLDLNVHQIQMFLAVARTGSITKAAEYLGISQSALSKNINSIERELGLALFIRTKRTMKLTPAGKILADEFSKIPDLIETALIKAHHQQYEQTHPLIIGLPASVNTSVYIQPALTRLRNQLADFDYYIDFYPFGELPFVLMDGDVDLVFTALFQKPMMERMHLHVQCVKEMPLLALMTTGNPLCAYDTISAQQLRTQKIISLSGATETEYLNNVVFPLCAGYNFIPQISYYASSAEAISLNLKNDDEICIIDEHYRLDKDPGKVLKPIEDSQSGIIAVWNSSEHIYLHRLVEEVAAACG